LADAATSRPARRARSWRLFRAFAYGDRAVGRDQAAELTFWQPGSSGLVERIGTRGQDRFDPRCPATTELLDGRPYPGRTAFPVGHDLERFTGPVDVVYTWVDGQDPEWQATLRDVLEDHDGPAADHSMDPARFRSRDELLYSMRSVWALCGWVRKIFVVTAGQVPGWLVGHDRVRVVDHDEILPASALPTFNSHAIESSLHRIDELAEHFIYLNDDMFVGRPLRPEIFFTPNGLPKVFSSDARVPGVEDEHTLAVDTAARRGRELLAERFGRVATFKPHHSPYPLRRSTLEEIDREFPDVVKTTSHSRFRDPADLSIAASFALHYGLATGRAVPGEIHTDYVHVESARLSWHLDRIGRGRDLDTFCLNETETVPGEHHDREVAISKFLDGYFPVPAPWERPLESDA
jgi:hypothetical protein